MRRSGGKGYAGAWGSQLRSGTRAALEVRRGLPVPVVPTP